MKAYGFPLYSFGLMYDPMNRFQNIYGVCIDETGKFLGSWTSSNLGFLKYDLQNHAKEYEYEFVTTPDLHPIVKELLIEMLNKEEEK